MISTHDRNTIRELAKRWRDLANQPVMEERKRLWKAVHDLKQERPVILVETQSINGFVKTSELTCEDPFLKNIERTMLDDVRHAEEVGDDIVLEPYFRISWQLPPDDFGVPVELHPALTATNETSLGYTFNFPIEKPEDIRKLKKRVPSVDREKTMRYKSLLEDIMGDILPIKVGNYNPFVPEFGDEGWTGNFFFGLTWQVYRFLGNNSFMYWLYDSPDTIRWLMQYMYEHRMSLFEFLEKENLLVPNTDNQMAGPRSYGYTSDLPGPMPGGKVTLKNLWGWAESQESTIISPDMYKEFVLPYLADMSKRFGLIYYGCCEPVDDRLHLIMEAIPNLRSVSVSGWSNFAKVGEMLGGRYVFSRKPTPAYLSGANPDWGLAEEDMKKTYAATKNGNVEILLRDLYEVNGDMPRLARWVGMTKSIFGI